MASTLSSVTISNLAATVCTRSYLTTTLIMLLLPKMREDLFAIGEGIMNCNEKVLEFGT